MIENTLVYLQNVKFELYRACLNGEIDQDTFFTVKKIVDRAKKITKNDVKYLLIKNSEQ